MKTNASRREIEQLTAYLDGELSASESARLEARLKSNPELRVLLEDLRRTKALLRSLPPQRAPRHFTLTPQMAGIRPSPPALFSALRLASALATILLVLVLAGDFLGLIAPLSAPQYAPPAIAEHAVEAPGEGTAKTESVPVLGIAPAVGIETVVVDQGITPTADAMQEMQVQAMEITLTQAMTEATRLFVEVTPTPSEEIFSVAGGGFLQATATPTPEPTPSPTPTLTPTTLPTPSETPLPPTPIPSETPLSLAEILPATEQAIPPTPLPAPPERLKQGDQVLRVVEGVLAMIAILTGLAAILLRRGASR